MAYICAYSTHTATPGRAHGGTRGPPPVDRESRDRRVKNGETAGGPKIPKLYVSRESMYAGSMHW